ncbi:uncharacterized protein TRUGW13939_08920 [Talaromyces rugulosus]|uniref:SUN domain-containing protein n=1 Tax=Talaromyces rugulosus TaxID=121627 RepID=A0A7H8R5W0_TALRU|nr:uncharacterized protein TRUGW13939_08920 [Talaromyces rugulosus]QKX61764.1 hypothetical protein TRUGW13939_08920 [Talaromyces rugulosus]
MRANTMASRLAAIVGLVAIAEAAHSHGHLHHRRHPDTEKQTEKRGGQCEFPSDAGLVAVTPDEQNAGWAMSPNQLCEPGSYCPYACPPGQVSMQWNPKATSYTYPLSMDGGLYCDESGTIQKPFPEKPYCADGTGAVNAVNKAGKPLSFCQTVLPGNEAMLIPTLVEETATLAVPDPSYWCSTAAHFYINPPGTGDEGCIWGTSDNPIGNWAYFVAGANTDSDGNTFVKIGYNPVVQEPATPFRDTPATYGVEITCEDDAGCNGLPCKIDPSSDGLNEVTSNESADGAGGGAFCVVTVPKGQTANINVFEAGDSSAPAPSGPASTTSPATSSAPPTTTSTSTTSTSTTPTTTSTSTTPTTTTTTTTSTTPTTTSTTPTTTTTKTSTSKHVSTTSPSSTKTTPSSTPASRTPSGTYSYAPHVFIETGSGSAGSPTGSSGASAASATTSGAAAPMSTGSVAGLALGLFAGVMMQL